MEQARMHALSVTPFMRGQQGMPGGGGAMGGGGRGGANGTGGGHRGGPPSESAYAAYQAALQTLATRQTQNYANAQVGGYPAAGNYGGAEYAAANGAQVATQSYGGSYGNAEYAAAAGYGQGSGYGQVAGGYAGGASATGGYGTAPASAGYASAGGTANQANYYTQQATTANGGAPQGYTAADYTQYSNYYYSPQTGTYQ
jgi:hypothetical protein